MSKKTVLCAMSGGVDSAVAAYLLKEQGYNVIGITMKTWTSAKPTQERSCCGIDDVSDARRVAAQLDIPYMALDMQEVFDRTVIDNFSSEYLKGRTPNPCIVCNYKLKFGYLMEKADELGADLVATGHYAQIKQRDGRYCIVRGEDEAKDQSYVLYNLTQDQLSRILFPLSEYEKTQIREIAAAQGFKRVANKPDSVEICFVDKDYRDFLKKSVPEQIKKARYVSKTGEDLGESPGVAMVTVGQRKGLGVHFQEKTYVTEINAQENKVVLGSREDLKRTTMLVNRVNWVSMFEPEEQFHAQVKIRYQHTPSQARVIPMPDNQLKVVFDEPQEQIAPGQSAVFYDGEFVLAGGLIERCL